MDRASHCATNNFVWLCGAEPVFPLSDYTRTSQGEKQRILLWFCTCIVKGVSFFLLIVLSSMVSGTEKLIILLEIKGKK